MRIFFLLVIMIAYCGGCMDTNDSLITSKMWSDLDVYKGRDMRDGLRALDRLLGNSNNINGLLDFIENKLTTSWRISHKDQIKLAAILSKIRDKQLNEKQENRVNNLIRTGQKYRDFYILVLSVEPKYLLTSLEVFKEQDNSHANVFNPDGGKVKVDIKKDYLRRLKRSTKQNFGYDYEKWKEWWLTKGQHLHYDKKQKVYYE